MEDSRCSELLKKANWWGTEGLYLSVLFDVTPSLQGFFFTPENWQYAVKSAFIAHSKGNERWLKSINTFISKLVWQYQRSDSHCWHFFIWNSDFSPFYFSHLKHWETISKYCPQKSPKIFVDDRVCIDITILVWKIWNIRLEAIYICNCHPHSLEVMIVASFLSWTGLFSF